MVIRRQPVLIFSAFLVRANVSVRFSSPRLSFLQLTADIPLQPPRANPQDTEIREHEFHTRGFILIASYQLLIIPALTSNRTREVDDELVPNCPDGCDFISFPLSFYSYALLFGCFPLPALEF